MPNISTDRDQIWHTYAYSSGNGHELKKTLIPEGHGGLGGHQFINLVKLPNHGNDRDQIWRTYTDSPGNSHRLNKLTPRGIWRGVRGSEIQKMWERCQTAVPIGTKFGTRMHIHLGMDTS